MSRTWAATLTGVYLQSKRTIDDPTKYFLNAPIEHAAGSNGAHAEAIFRDLVDVAERDDLAYEINGVYTPLISLDMRDAFYKWCQSRV